MQTETGESRKLLSRLSRVTTAGKTFIPQIDGLRFIAIMAVIAFHVRGVCRLHAGAAAPEQKGGMIGDLFDAGHFGVQLFFAISGFVLALPFAKHCLKGAKPIRLRDYYVRRITRIEPPYIIHLVFLIGLSVLVLRRLPSHPHLYHDDGWARYLLAHIFASLIYVDMFVYRSHPYPNIVLWSLAIEVQFYLLAPFIAKVFAIGAAWKRRLLLAAVIVAASLVLGWFGPGNYVVDFSLLGCLQYFLVGFLLVDLYLGGRIGGASGNFIWDLIFLLSGVAVVLVNLHQFWIMVLPWIFFCMCLAGFQGRAASRLLGNPWITTVGGMCYTVYMYHWLMISALFRGTVRLQTGAVGADLLLQFLVMAPIIVLVCTGFFVLFERPFMQKNWPARIAFRLKY